MNIIRVKNRFFSLFLHATLITSILFGFAACRWFSVPPVDPKATLVLLPLTTSNQTRILCKSLALPLAELESSLLKKLRNNKMFRFVKDSKKKKHLFAMEIELRVRTLRFNLPKPRERKDLSFKLDAAVIYHFHPIGKTLEPFIFRESKQKSYHFKEIPSPNWFGRLFKSKSSSKGKARKWLREKWRIHARKLLRSVWKQGFLSLARYTELQKTSSPELFSLLQKSKASSSLFGASVKLLGERQYKPAIPRLLELLKVKDQREELLISIVRAFTQLRDQRVVVPMIELSRGRSDEFFNQLISAIAEIGGEQAKSFLYTVAVGHNSRLVRRSAKEAFEELQEHEQPKGD